MKPKARQGNLLVQEVGKEIVIYDQERRRVHRLNSTAASIWRHCDGQNTVEELTGQLTAELRLPAQEEVVWLALDRLQKAHLLSEALVLPQESRGLSRRELIRKMALAGGMVALLPVVTSIAAPTPAMAASLGSGTASGGKFAPYVYAAPVASTVAAAQKTRGLCFCVAPAPAAPAQQCVQSKVGSRAFTNSASGKCTSKSGLRPDCTGSCVITAEWVCQKNGAAFAWEQVETKDSCRN